MNRLFTINFYSTTIFAIALFLSACSDKEVKKAVEYSGPLSEGENVELYYSEGDRVKIKMKAAVVYEYQTGDREFPKGIYIEFFNEFGMIESTLRANEAYFFKAENQWRGRGKVEVKNILKQEQLNTEELFWKPNEQKIFTEKFVTIREERNIIWGTGLDAKQDLNDYTINKVEGELEMKEEGL